MLRSGVLKWGEKVIREWNLAQPWQTAETGSVGASGRLFCPPVNHDGAPSLFRPIKAHKPWKLNIMSQVTELRSRSHKARQHNLGCSSHLFPPLFLSAFGNSRFQTYTKSLSWGRNYSRHLRVISEQNKDSCQSGGTWKQENDL